MIENSFEMNSDKLEKTIARSTGRSSISFFISCSMLDDRRGYGGRFKCARERLTTPHCYKAKFERFPSAFSQFPHRSTDLKEYSK